MIQFKYVAILKIIQQLQLFRETYALFETLHVRVSKELFALRSYNGDPTEVSTESH